MKIIHAVIVATAVTGCASTATKNAQENTRNVHRAYAQVVDVYEANNRDIRRVCSNLQHDQDSQAVCAHLDDYNIAKAVVMRVNRFITWQIPVPKSEHVPKDSFLEFAPARQMASFVRIASLSPTEACKWEGPSTYQFENSASGVVTGFVSGMLIVPAVVGLSSDDAMAGGVICDGWTYKSLLGKN